MRTKLSLFQILPFAGTLPFVMGALFLLFGVDQIPYFGSIDRVVLSYALAIISFMAGVHWGHYVSGARTRVNLLVSSNVVTLGAWFGFLLLPKFYFCLLLMVLFVVLLSIDGHLRSAARIDAAYMKMRRAVTSIVIISLGVVAFA